MLKEAIEKIQELCMARTEIVDGITYLLDGKGHFQQIRPELDFAEPTQLTSLEALVQFVKEEALKRYPKVYITVPDHLTVKCFTGLNDDLRKNREYLYKAVAQDVPGWESKVSLGFEEALIALRTRFQHATDTEYALRLLSNITTGGKVTYNDNGVATSIVTKRGIDLQNNETIRPIIKLRPYRTFQEVEQPESDFLIRLNERNITFLEADGGMWKLAARNTVKQYLVDALSGEVDAGAAVISM